MIIYLKIVFFSGIVLRLLTLFISSRNEKKLKSMGAVEYGKTNSSLLILGHTLYYILCCCEGIKQLNFHHITALAGLLLYIFSITMLYVVIVQLAHIWTVKLIIAPGAYHRINTGWLFRTVRHPNYYLNVIPELIGFALVLQAWHTLLIAFPIQLIPLIIRIREEEKLMRRHFHNYV